MVDLGSEYNDPVVVARYLGEVGFEFDRAVVAAARLGPEGEQLLIHALDGADLYVSTWVVAGLGDATGPAGTKVLRQVLTTTGPGTSNTRCVTVLALAKRAGPDSTRDLIAALASRDPALKRYALMALAGAGDGSAWDPVLAELRRILTRRRPGSAPRSLDDPRSTVTAEAVCVALAYLGQHATRPEQLAEVRDLITHRWNRLHPGEKAFIARHWSSLAPDASNPGILPDSTALRTWARSPNFDPLDFLPVVDPDPPAS